MMKVTVTLLTLVVLFSPIGLAQDLTQSNLPTGAIARLGKGSISEIAYSPDGTRLAIATSIDAWLYDTTTHREIALLTGHTDIVLTIAFSPDGKLLASGGMDETIRLCDAVTGKPRRVLTGHEGRVKSLAFSPDGNILASGSADKTVRLWEARNSYFNSMTANHGSMVTSVAFGPDGRLAAGCHDGTVRLWEVNPSGYEKE